MSSLEVQLREQDDLVSRLLQERPPPVVPPAEPALEIDDVPGESGSVLPAPEEVGRPVGPVLVLPSAPTVKLHVAECWGTEECVEATRRESRPQKVTIFNQPRATAQSASPLEFGPQGWRTARSDRSLIDDYQRNKSLFTKMLDMTGLNDISPDLSCWSYAYLQVIRLIHWWYEVQEPPRSGCVYSLISNHNFDILCAVVISLNAVYTGIAANYEINNLTVEPTQTMFLVEFFFMTFYTIEIILKLFVHRQYFFCNQEMGWNIFDIILVLLAILDIITVHQGGDGGSNVNFARSLRIFKMGKIARMFRVLRFLRELRVMMASILGSFASLFWSLVMLGMIVYVFALVFVQAMTVRLAHGQGMAQEDKDMAEQYLGSVERASKSLYQVTTGGVDWEIVYNMIEPCGWVYSIAFIFYIAFWTFAVMNILTGIFVDKALKLTAPDREQVMLEQRRKMEADGDELRRLCHAMDLDESGTLTLDEWSDCLQDDRVAHYLSTLGLEVKDAGLFFSTMMEVNGSDDLDIDDFVEHCMRMKGLATSIDLQGLAFQTKLMARDIEQVRSDLSNLVAQSPGKHQGVEEEQQSRKFQKRQSVRNSGRTACSGQRISGEKPGKRMTVFACGESGPAEEGSDQKMRDDLLKSLASKQC